MNPEAEKSLKHPRTIHRLTHRQYKLLYERYQHSAFLYPDVGQELADQLRLPVKSILNWFRNRRRLDRSRLLDIDPSLRDLNPGLENPHVFAEQFEKHKAELLRVTETSTGSEQATPERSEEKVPHSNNAGRSFGPICQSSNMTDNSHYEEHHTYFSGQTLAHDAVFSVAEGSVNVSQASVSTFFSGVDYDQTSELQFETESSSYANPDFAAGSLEHSNLNLQDSSVHFHNPSAHLTQQANFWWDQNEIRVGEGEEQHQHAPESEICNQMVPLEASLRFNTPTAFAPTEMASYNSNAECALGWYYEQGQTQELSSVTTLSSYAPQAYSTHHMQDYSYSSPAILPAINQGENMEVLPTCDTPAMGYNMTNPLFYPSDDTPPTPIYGMAADQRLPSVLGPSTSHCHVTSTPVNQQYDGQLTQFQTAQSVKNAPSLFSQTSYEYPFHQSQNNYESFEQFSSSPEVAFDPSEFDTDLV